MEGIDPEFLAALPPELQAEVMENQVGVTSLWKGTQGCVWLSFH